MGNSNGKESLIGSLNALRTGLGSESLFPNQEYAPLSGEQPTQKAGEACDFGQCPKRPISVFGPRSTGWVDPAAYNEFTNDTTGYSSYKGTDYVICEGRSCSTDAECCDKFTCQMGRCVL